MDGLLVIDKPAGITSHDVVARARRILRERRIGHTGTLDPFATGVLVLLVGQATRLAQFVSATNKEYEAIIRLGFATDTGDIEGERLVDPNENQNAYLELSDNDIRAALSQLCGPIEQVPPMYSAKKRGGQKLYELARRGQQIKREPVCITIYKFESIDKEGDLLKDNKDGTFDLGVRVVCSAGTYVRTLAEDFGKLLGVGAHLAELRRICVGDFTVKDATTLEQLQQIVEESRLGTILLPPQAALSAMPFVHLSASDAQRARNGVTIPVAVAAWRDGERVGMIDEEGRLIGVSHYKDAERQLQPRVILATKNTH
jgi:tRNA pseudouridine55 synthase